MRKYSPEVLFLCETKSKESEIRKVEEKLHFDKFSCIEANGRAGGLALFWLDKVNLRVIDQGSHFIDSLIGGPNGVLWQLTGVHGWSETGQKART